MQKLDSPLDVSPWPHRWAMVLACATFPLVWVGGLVTTTDAGMAVPDWPNTYGYNLFLYPWTSWLTGPWDLFIEHGHRLLGALVGMLTIGLVIAIWRCDARRWVRTLGAATLALVIAQGVLGGTRVLFDERTLAMIHGCVGPVFFSMTVALAAVTSRRWHKGNNEDTKPVSEEGAHAHAAFIVQSLALLTLVIAYLQIVLGASVRHISVTAPPSAFAAHLMYHLTVAGVLSLMILALGGLIWSTYRKVVPLRNLATILVSLLLAQIGLGLGTWALKFSAPQWFTSHVAQPGYTIEAGGWLQTHIVTAHVATGSLILATSVALALYSFRLLAIARPLISESTTGRWGVAV